ncbi:hypothetical protein KM043_011667 [Ampulex compressa]|nr:hypothetical protein KM043_011667 [Ampulex compressa]
MSCGSIFNGDQLQTSTKVVDEDRRSRSRPWLVPPPISLLVVPNNLPPPSRLPRLVPPVDSGKIVQGQDVLHLSNP